MAALCLLVSTGVLLEARAQSARARLRSIAGRQSEVRAALREVKADQAEAASALSAARRREQQAHSRAATARRRLEELRGILRAVKADLARTEQELGRQREAMSRRLLALYQAGQPSYLEVVLNATSFEDFANRAAFTRIMARQDDRLLTTLVGTEARLRARRAELEARERQAATLRTEAERHERIAAQATAEAERIVARMERDRATYEAELAALEAAERDVQALIRAQVSSGGGYVGSCSGRFLVPVSGRITSRYGWRTHPIWGDRRFHTGVDIGAPGGAPIRACDDGKVTFAGERGALGLAVVLDHGSGWSTVYGHCSAIYVRTGQVVGRGQTIAGVGTTGVSTGNHVHWSVYRNGNLVDPLSL